MFNHSQLKSQLKSTITTSLFTLTLTVALSFAAFAQGGSEQKIDFYLDGKVGSEVIKKGSYTVAIPDVEQGTIAIKVGKKTVTANFVRRAVEQESSKDKITFRENADGSRSVATITPGGRKYTLVLQDAASSVAQQ